CFLHLSRTVVYSISLHDALPILIPESAADWGVTVRSAEKLAAALREHREEAMLYRTLTTLRRDVPIHESLEDLEWKGYDDARFPDRKSTRLNSSHVKISYAVFCL